MTTVAEIDAEIAELEAYRRKRLTGQDRVKVSYDGTSVEKSIPTLEEINGQLALLRIERAKLTGDVSGYGPFGFSFGSRP